MLADSSCRDKKRNTYSTGNWFEPWTILQLSCYAGVRLRTPVKPKRLPFSTYTARHLTDTSVPTSHMAAVTRNKITRLHSILVCGNKIFLKR